MSLVRSCLGRCLIATVAATCVPLLADAQAGNSSLQRAAQLEERGQFAQAEQIYLEQEKRFPKNAEIFFHLGTLRMRQNDWPKAIEYLEKCRTLAPGNADVFFYLAQAYYLNRDLIQAQRTILSGVKLAPNEAAMLQKAGEYLCDGGDCGVGLVDLLKARKLDPTLENIDLDLGMAYYKLAKHEEAQAILESVLQKDPNNLVAASLLGKLAAYQGNWDKARTLDEFVLAREPRNVGALKDLGTALVALGKDEEALSPLHEALNLDPSLSDVHFQLGRAFRDLGRLEESHQEMELYQSIRDRQHSIQTLVSSDKASEDEHWRKCEKLLEKNGEAAAIAYVDSLAAETHTQLNGLYMLGMIYSAQGRNKDAIRVLSKAAETSRDDADIIAFLGRAYLREHDYQKSKLDLERALAVNPQNQIALVGMGELRYAMGQWQEAARYFDESRTQEVSALLLMCNAYMRADNRDKAHEAAELVRAFAHGDKQRLQDLKSSGCSGNPPESQTSTSSLE